MSALQPNGVPLKIAGEERNLLLSFSAIDLIQELYPGKSVFDVLRDMLIGEDSTKITCNLVSILWNDAVMRDHLLDSSKPLGDSYDSTQVAYLINVDNKEEIQRSILEACRVSVNDEGDDDEEDDPNITGATNK